MNINAFINRHLGIILLASAFSGLLIKTTQQDISFIIIVSLAVIIFASFFRVDLNRELAGDMKSSLVYFSVRFIVLPAVIYFLFVPVSPFYAVNFLLLLLLPAAVSSPAFTAMFGGNVAESLKLLVLTSFLSIATIPGITQLFLAKEVDIDGLQMFTTMVYTIVVPFALHLPFRRSAKN